MKAVTTDQIRELDRRTIEAGTAGEELMDRAGLAVARTAIGLLRGTDSRSILLFAGKGNNGGDAIVAARHLAAAGCHPVLVLFAPRNELLGDPLTHFQKLTGDVTVLESPGQEQLANLVAEVAPAALVDGLLGTGLTGDVREPFASAIQLLNELGRPVVAIDIPSGLDSDTGEVHGVAVRADVTVTAGLPKIGLLRPAATDYVGRLEVADIGFPGEFINELETDVELITAAEIRPLLPDRRPSAHKGDFGHLLIIAGSEGYTGAPVIAAHAAARSGAGLVTLAVPRDIYPIVAANDPPEVMPRPLDRFDSFDGFDAIALGPGLGQSADAQQLVHRLLPSVTVPTVVDADGLNALTNGLSLLRDARAPLVVTPHPGEMGRLIGKSAREVQANRWDTARAFAREHRLITVLKGAGTVVAAPAGPLWINTTGNPGMAKGGMGDALTGILGALLAQGLKPLDAARAAVYVHGLAGDRAAERHGQTALLVTDLIACLGDAFRRLD